MFLWYMSDQTDYSNSCAPIDRSASRFLERVRDPVIVTVMYRGMSMEMVSMCKPK